MQLSHLVAMECEMSGSQSEGKLQRLTPFERYMFEDDCDRYPMEFLLRLQLQEPLCLQCLQSTLKKLQDRHPLYFATIRRSIRGLCWKLGTTSPRLTQHQAGAGPQKIKDLATDLRKDSGLQLSLSRSEHQCEVWLRVHHCCSDARGALDFLADAMGLYRCHHSPVERLRAESDERDSECGHEASEITEPVSRRRTGFSQNYLGYLDPTSGRCRRLFGYYASRPRSIVKGKQAPPVATASQGLAFATRRFDFDSDEWRMSRQSEVNSPSFNDGVLASAFNALNNHVDLPIGFMRNVIRIAVPVDQRRSHGATDMACNRCSMVFVDRDAGQIADDRLLLESVTNEMQEVRRQQLCTVLHDFLRLMNCIPWGIRAAIAVNQSHPVTSVVSNLGELCPSLRRSLPEARGHGRLPFGAELDFLVPLRRGTRATFGVVTFARKVQMCLTYDPQFISLSRAEDILKHATDGFRRFLGLES